MEIKAEVNGTPLPQRNAGANAKGAAAGVNAAKGGNAVDKKPFVGNNAGNQKGGPGQNINRQSRGGRNVSGFSNNRFCGNQSQNQGGQNQAAKSNQGGQSAVASAVSHNSSQGGGSGSGGGGGGNRQSNAFFQRRNQNQSQNDVSVPSFCKKKEKESAKIFRFRVISKF